MERIESNQIKLIMCVCVREREMGGILFIRFITQKYEQRDGFVIKTNSDNFDTDWLTIVQRTITVVVAVDDDDNLLLLVRNLQWYCSFDAIVN